jgi:hypothetical protein
MQTVDWFDSKTPAEIVAISFDFKNVVASVDSIDSVLISVKEGVDSSVNSMLFNSPTLIGSVVTQLISGGVQGATYLISATVIKGNEKYSLAGYLPIKAYQ